MAFYHRSVDRKRIDYRRHEEEVVGSLCRLSSRPTTPKSLLEQEKRIRREIANSNERRRMQSINAGFLGLRSLLPHREGEKLSKAAILQNTADYIFKLEDKIRIMEKINQLPRGLLNSPQHNHDSDGSSSDSPLPKKKKRETVDSVDEGIGSSSPSRSDNGMDDIKRENIELRLQLDNERALRMILEEQIRNMDCRLYSNDCVSDSADQLNLHYHLHGGVEGLSKTSISMMNLGHESGLGSPQSQVSSQDVESSHEMSPRASSPELSGSEVPEDLSGKSNSALLPCVNNISLSDVSNIPELLLLSSPEHITSILTYESNLNRQGDCKFSTSRQNLETIVEAIRHVEGDHMFRDDPIPSNSHLTQCVEQVQCVETVKKEHVEEQTHQSVPSNRGTGFIFQHQIIRNAPITQSRPGVIVSNLS